MKHKFKKSSVLFIISCFVSFSAYADAEKNTNNEMNQNVNSSRSKMSESKDASDREVIVTRSISLSGEKLSQLVVDSAKTYKKLASKEHISEAALREAECIAIFPNIVTVAAGLGGQHGNGTITCKGPAGQWSQMGFVNLDGVSFGPQLGVKSTSAIIILNNKDVRVKLEKGSVSLAAAASAVLGKEDAEKTYLPKSKAVTIISDSAGAFLGASLDTAFLAIDDQELKEFYDENAKFTSVITTYDIPNKPLIVKEFIQLMPKS